MKSKSKLIKLATILTLMATIVVFTSTVYAASYRDYATGRLSYYKVKGSSKINSRGGTVNTFFIDIPKPGTTGVEVKIEYTAVHRDDLTQDNYIFTKTWGHSTHASISANNPNDNIYRSYRTRGYHKARLGSQTWTAITEKYNYYN